MLAISPIVGQLYGAQRLREAGHQLHQGVWLAAGLAVIGCSVLAFPAPFLAHSRASPEVAVKVRYLMMLALRCRPRCCSLCSAGFNTLRSRTPGHDGPATGWAGAEGAAVHRPGGRCSLLGIPHGRRLRPRHI